MIWAIPAAMAAMGAIGGENQRRQQDRANQASAESNRYSWVNSHYTNPVDVTGSALGGALQGGVSGLAMGQQFGNGPSQPAGPKGVGPVADGGSYDKSLGGFGNLQSQPVAGSAMDSPWGNLSKKFRPVNGNGTMIG